MKVVKIATTTAVLVLLLFALIIGCGKDFTHNAPDGASITFSPSSLNFSVPPVPGFVVTQPITIRVADSANKPMNGIKVIITGAWAFPNDFTNYYFYDETNTIQYSSGFTGVTDPAGVYNFSIQIPSSSVTGSVVFTDNIEARSGTAYNNMEIKFNK